ncbi:hypothetical protein G6F59_014007 [Rhizopus arrhizus]|nr:hypothetical protein G6F59_014007 [Rhizopus arrhizus]
MRVVLVEYGDVVVDVFLVDIHAAQAVVDDHRQFVVEGRVVGHATGNHRRQHVAVAIVVLQAFAHQRGAAGGGAQQETARTRIGRGPCQVADALQPEHRIEDVERNRGQAMVAVGGAGGDPRTDRTGFVDAFLQDLPVPGFLVVAQLAGVLRGVQLAEVRMDADLAEQAFHTEGA